MRVTLADGSYIDCSIAGPLFVKLCGILQKSSSGVSDTVHVGCSVLYHALPDLTSDMVLCMDWLHTINPLINWNNYSLFLKYRGEPVRILGTK